MIDEVQTRKSACKYQSHRHSPEELNELDFSPLC